VFGLNAVSVTRDVPKASLKRRLIVNINSVDYVQALGRSTSARRNGG
jgi:hypothetical protein